MFKIYWYIPKQIYFAQNKFVKFEYLHGFEVTELPFLLYTPLIL